MDYSELKTAEEKLDMVLRYMVNLPSRELLTRDQIASNMNAVPYEKEITEILLKLHKDGYIHASNELGTGYFYTNFDGRILIDNGGYVEERKQKITNDTISSQNETRIIRNERLLVNGTWFAGIAAVFLLLWNVWIWFYPVHKDYPYWFWDKSSVKKHTKAK